jgi:type IV secretory pathway ATPase VirB11/archaellum biosynthesis ATPase
MSAEAIDQLQDIMQPLQPWLSNKAVTDVAVNRPGEAFVREAGVFTRYDVDLDYEDCVDIAILAGALNKQNVNSSLPLVGTELPDGSRLQAVLPPCVPQATASLTFRVHETYVAPMEDAVKRYDVSRWNQWQTRHDARRADYKRLLDAYDSGDIVRFFYEIVRLKFTPILCGHTGAGKAQPYGSLVLTPTGFRPIESLSTGDLITTPKGEIARLTGVHPQGEKEIFRVTFEDGRTVECCDDHLWNVWVWQTEYETGKTHATRQPVDANARWRTLPLSEIRRWFDTNQVKADRAAVPLVQPFAIELPPATLPIPPYALGALLGDGHFACSIHLSSADYEIVDRVMTDLPDYEVVLQGKQDYRLRQKKQKKYSPLQTALQNLGLQGTRSHNKFVPEIYKRGSSVQRLAMLQGLLDTDGSVGHHGKGATLTTTSYQLAKDVQELAWSLGAIASISPRQTHFTYNGQRRAGRPSWRVNIKHPDLTSFFSLPRKVSLCRPASISHRLKIIKIEPVGKKPARCITVNTPEGLYVTDNYVVTHNSTFLKTLVALIDALERIITIENALELDIVNQPNYVRLLYSHGQQSTARVTQHELLQALLRMRPDRVFVGELRDPDATYVFFDEMTTGHRGSATTVHGATAPQAALRLFTQFKASRAGANYSDDMIKSQLASAIDVIIPFRETEGVYEIGEVWLSPDAERRHKSFHELFDNGAE